MKRHILLSALLLVVCPVSGVRAQVVGGIVRDRAAEQIAKGSASISGVVVAADSGRPLRLARVVAVGGELPEGGRVAMTDETGHFELSELPAGSYTLSASRTGYITVNFGQRRPLRAGKPVAVRDGQRVGGIDFHLPRGSAITGRVLDQDGEPLVRATVRAFRSRIVQGEGRIEPAAGAQTDDRGQFRIYGLVPGIYYVSATGNTTEIARALATDAEWRAQFANPGGAGDRGIARGGALDDDGDVIHLTYAPTYYPGVATLADAMQVNVPLAQDVGGIDFSLQLVTAARVSGTVLGSNGAAGNAVVMLVADEPRSTSTSQSYSTRTNRDGTFSISNVPPGRYLVSARTGGGRGGRGAAGPDSEFALAPLSVSGGAVTGVTLMLGPGATITGQATFEGGALPSPSDLSRIRIGLWATSSQQIPMLGGQMNATPRNDGTFTISNVPGGSRVVRVSGVPRPFALKSVYLDGHDVTDSAFEIRPGETGGRLTVVFTDRGTEISGTVRDEQDNSVTEVTVVAFAADAQVWRPQSRFIQAVRPAKDATYSLRGLPPGEYLLQAVDDLEQGEWYDPAILDTLRAGATRVLLQEGNIKTVDLKLKVASRQ